MRINIDSKEYWVPSLTEQFPLFSELLLYNNRFSRSPSVSCPPILLEKKRRMDKSEDRTQGGGCVLPPCSHVGTIHPKDILQCYCVSLWLKKAKQASNIQILCFEFYESIWNYSYRPNSDLVVGAMYYCFFFLFFFFSKSKRFGKRKSGWLFMGHRTIGLSSEKNASTW